MSKAKLAIKDKVSLERMGIGNPNWRGGVAAEPYCDAWLDIDYKRSIVERDGEKCMNPSCGNFSTRLVVHHIDYNKKNCTPINLITLCNSCNGRANSKRKTWKKFYNKIIEHTYYYE
jgi:hypothetical protein